MASRRDVSVMTPGESCLATAVFMRFYGSSAGRVGSRPLGRFRSTKPFVSAPSTLQSSRRDDAVMTGMSTVPSTGRVKPPPPGPSRLPGGSDSPCRSHRRGRSRAHLLASCSSCRSSAGLVHRGRAVPAFRVALHAPSREAPPAGVCVVAARLLAHLEDIRERRGPLGRREPALRGRAADGRRLPVELRLRVPGTVRACGPMAGRGSDSGRVARLAGSGLGCVAEHVEGVRVEVTA